MDNELKSGFGEDITYDSSLGSSNDKDSGATVFQNVAMNENAAKANMQSNDLRRLIAEYPEKINQSVLRKGTTIPKQASADTLKGFVFEKHAALSTEIDSVANGNPIWKVQVFTDGLLPDGTVLTGIDKSEDLVAFVKEHFWSKPVKTDSGQFKTHSNNNRIAYKIEARNQNYQGQQMIGSTNAPKDLFKTSFEVHLKGGKTVKSDPIDDETLKQMAEQAKKQNAPEYAHADEKIKRMNEVNMQNAIKAGAFAGLAISTIKEICTVIAHKDELPEDQFLISVQNILCGTIEGGVRSGAIVGSMQIAEKILGRSLSAGEAVLPMALANVAVDFSKDLYACFVTKQIDTDDLLCNTIDNTYSSVAGFGGGYIGGQAGASIFTSIATSTKIGAALGSAAGPLGTVVGTVVGGLLIGCAVQGVIGVANKDAAKAFQESLDKINSNESFTGYDKMFYFADEMGSLSEFKLSFKCLLPCYNLISDMREYNMRKKAMNNIRAQLESNIDNLYIQKNQRLKEMESIQQQRIEALQDRFEEQEELLHSQYRKEVHNYIDACYGQFISLQMIYDQDTDKLVKAYECNVEEHNAILQYMEERIQTNERINSILDEFMELYDDRQFIMPIIYQIQFVMNQDKLLIGKQHISYEDALLFVRGRVSVC